MSEEEKLTPLNTTDRGGGAKKLRDFLGEKIIGQESPLDFVADACDGRVIFDLSKNRKNLNEPIAKVLFCGPTGVGKTEVVKRIAEFFFESRTSLTIIECSKYSQEHQVAQLIGSPPGYVGFNDPNDPAHYNPHSSYPVLSQWNIDKFHFYFLRKEKDKVVKAENIRKRINALNKGEKELEVRSERIKMMVDGVFEVQKESIVLVEGHEKAPDQASKRKIRLSLIKKRQHLKILKRAIAEATIRAFAQGGALEAEKSSLDAELSKNKGLIYDHSDPADYLSIILFDEIEKAHPNLFNHLLEILDEGQLHLSNGKITSFRNSLIFLTSNIGSGEIAGLVDKESIGFKKQETTPGSVELGKNISNVAAKEAENLFPPEFIGRLDKIIVFHPLNIEDLFKILELNLLELHIHFRDAGRPIAINVDHTVKEFIVRKSMKESKYGARKLKDKVRQYITQKLNRAFNNGSLNKDDTVIVKLENVNGNEEVVFYKK